MAVPRYSPEQQFLNRIALFTDDNALLADPRPAIEHVFELAPLPHLQEKWREYSLIAIQEGNQLEEGHAACLDYFNRLELLVEAAWLAIANDAPESLSFEDFFGEITLSEWKRILDSWRTAVMANHALDESVETVHLLTCFLKMIQLLDDAFTWLKTSDEDEQLKDRVPDYLLAPAV
ncbi:hypothetical protein [Flavihumibacter petaseus]|uniref:Uncharacterized protein n=1 Tax=Flavihumibacter petaseus NBRC 106054 TaxID=1220578 RepID=A0A0E9N5Z9_9BACT|nr:hypothetical protein [Flavihumibacter petaseus]GAO45254.1 hypothetical protein FPE01S_04_04970 [Flavihumibacter petaseus NBRC 106054]